MSYVNNSIVQKFKLFKISIFLRPNTRFLGEIVPKIGINI